MQFLPDRAQVRRRDGERGAALVLVIAALSLVLLVLLIALSSTSMSQTLIKRQLTYQGQVTNAASAGLVEALSWFVHQRAQVTAFNPQLDPGGVCTHTPPHVPPVNDTEDPAVGIVRSFRVTNKGSLWGRYEVRRAAVRDISTRRGKPTPGSIWQLESDGIIYVRNDASVAPDTAPNRVIARRTMRTEIQRLGFTLPANAAISSSEGRRVSVSASSRVQGGSSGIGIAYPPSTGTPSIARTGTVSGTPAQSTTSGSFVLQDIFGMTTQELVNMADLVVDRANQLPATLSEMSLIVIRGDATFNPQTPLNGSGILVVLGNLIINPQSNSSYNGLVYVGGNFVLGDSSTISGAVIANGNTQINGTSNVAEVIYDPNMLDQITQQMGNYLFSRSPYLINAGIDQ